MSFALAMTVAVCGAEKRTRPYLLLLPHLSDNGPLTDRHGRGSSLPDPRLREQLTEAGFGPAEIAVFCPQLTLDFLEKFNIVILGAGGEGNQKALLNPEADTNMATVLDYVKAGGSLLVLRNPGWQFGKDIEEYNRWLKPTGIEILPEQIDDDEHAVELVARARLYWTDNLAKDPITEGVRGFFYPAAYPGYSAYTDFTSPVKASADWKILARGMDSASSTFTVKGKQGGATRPGTYDKAPPFLAVRDYGKGRIAVMPVASSPIWQDAYHVLWGRGMAMEGGRKDMPADNARLMLNLFAWLTEPGASLVGGYQLPPPVEKPIDIGFGRIDWDKVKFRGLDRPECYMGLIGAHSELSTGKGKPEAFIAAAKAAGYQFIAFTEDIDKLTPAKFDQLKQICAAASDETFQACPGFQWLDDSGNAWVTFSDQLTWPEEGWFSTTHPGRLAVNNALARGWGWPPIILLHPHLNPEPAWFQGNFHKLSLYTYRNGELLDDAVDVYRRMLRDTFHVDPVAVHLIDSPEAVAKARQTGYQSYVRWFDNNVSAAYTSIREYAGRSLWYNTTFVSEGPVIEDMRILNFGMSDLTVPDNDRFRVHLQVADPAGLAEVLLLDADREEPLRRFLPGGADRFEITLDMYHERQHELIAVATNTAGKKMVGWRNRTIVQENAFLRCGDNYNTMPRGKWWGEPKNLMNVHGFENYLATRNFRYFGSPRIAGIKELERPAIEYYPVMACRFGSIVEARIDRHYAMTASGNSDKVDISEVAEANTVLAGVTTYTTYLCRQDGSLVEHVQGDYRFLNDTKGGPPIVGSALGRPDALTVAATLDDGSFYAGIMSERNRYPSGMMPPRGWAALFPSVFRGSLGYIALQDGLGFVASSAAEYTMGSMRVQLGVRNAPREFKAGEPLQFDFLGVQGKLDPDPDTRFVTDIIEKLGIKGDPACAITASQGKVVSRGYETWLEAADHGFRGHFGKAALPLDLPVRIKGLNPRWDAGIVYLGKATLMRPEWIWNDRGEHYAERRPHQVENELLHIPVLPDGSGFLQVDTEAGAKQVFIGNLLVADSPDVTLLLADCRPGKVKIEVHNPTDQPITCTVRPGPGFELIGSFAIKVTVAAGTSGFTLLTP